MATLEDASRCPICDVPGVHRSSSPSERGSTVRIYNCVNEQCRWFNTGWVVQVKADGTVAERPRGEKEFTKLTPGQEAMARAVIEDAINSDLREA